MTIYRYKHGIGLILRAVVDGKHYRFREHHRYPSQDSVAEQEPVPDGRLATEYEVVQVLDADAEAEVGDLVEDLRRAFRRAKTLLAITDETPLGKQVAVLDNLISDLGDIARYSLKAVRFREALERAGVVRVEETVEP